MTSAPCNLCKSGVREEFSAKMTGKEYVRCTNGKCGFFCAVGRFEEYEELVEGDAVGEFYKGVDSPECHHERAAALRISSSQANPGRAYFACSQTPKCTFFTWGDVETEPMKKKKATILPTAAVPYDPYASYAPKRAEYLKAMDKKTLRRITPYAAATNTPEYAGKQAKKQKWYPEYIPTDTTHVHTEKRKEFQGGGTMNK